MPAAPDGLPRVAPHGPSSPTVGDPSALFRVAACVAAPGGLRQAACSAVFRGRYPRLLPCAGPQRLTHLPAAMCRQAGHRLGGQPAVHLRLLQQPHRHHRPAGACRAGQGRAAGQQRWAGQHSRAGQGRGWPGCRHRAAGGGTPCLAWALRWSLLAEPGGASREVTRSAAHSLACRLGPAPACQHTPVLPRSPPRAQQTPNPCTHNPLSL